MVEETGGSYLASDWEVNSLIDDVAHNSTPPTVSQPRLAV